MKRRDKKVIKKFNEFSFSPIKIVGKTYRVFEKKKKGGGWFYGKVQKIYIGEDQSKEGKLEILLHEVLELALMECGYRYARFQVNRDGYDNDGYKFVMDHAEYENFVRAFAGSLRPFIKKFNWKTVVKKSPEKKGKK